ncbi:MAG: sulfotransferase [Oceanicaulis sp.]
MQTPSQRAQLDAAEAALLQESYREAHGLLMAALQANPNEAKAFFLLAILAADHDNHAKAIELFDRALQHGHAAGPCQARAARSALALSRREEAVERARKAAAAPSLEAVTLDTIGVVYSRAGLHEEAIALYQAATEAAPKVSGYWYNLGAGLQFVGDFEGARQAFDTCLTLNAGDSRARVARVSITKQTLEDNDMAGLKKAWAERPADDADSALQIAHALAKCHEDLGDPNDAMAWLGRGKAHKLKHVADREADDAALFFAARDLAETLPIQPSPDGAGPVFITGMPRTGTTLVDRIVSSHADMTAAGELSDFSVLLKRALGTKGPFVLDADTLRAAGSADLRQVGRAYLDRVSSALEIAGRFTDKMPLNIFFAPAILAAIPSARVICLKRHPADTALSNYRQLFATSFSYYAYAYDLEWTARYVVAFNSLIEAFESALPPGRFRIVEYEAILDDQEAVTRSVLDFCGLEFDPACLRFHENSAPVATASAAQVRQPLYTGSRGRWKRYRPALDPALDILSAAGLLTGRD